MIGNLNACLLKSAFPIRTKPLLVVYIGSLSLLDPDYSTQELVQPCERLDCDSEDGLHPKWYWLIKTPTNHEYLDQCRMTSAAEPGTNDANREQEENVVSDQSCPSPIVDITSMEGVILLIELWSSDEILLLTHNVHYG